MLEPAVRPGAVSGGGGAQQAKPAFENRSFQDLLSDAGLQAEQDSDAGENGPAPANPLGALGGLGQIENAALRSMLAQTHKPGGASGATI